MLIEDDAGDVAAVTDSGWRAQTFYVSPVYERDCVVVEGNVRASDTCSTEGRNSADGISAAFWALPEGWEQPDFDAGDWPAAVEFTNDTVGVNNKPAYTNFTDLFDRPVSYTHLTLPTILLV